MSTDERTDGEALPHEVASPYLTTEAFEWNESSAGTETLSGGFTSPWMEAGFESEGVFGESETYEEEEECEAGEGFEGLEDLEEEFATAPLASGSCNVPALAIRGPIPTSTPEGHCIPFAVPPASGGYWPLVTSHRRDGEVAYQAATGAIIGNRSRRFLAVRSGRLHAAIDLYANDGDTVVACESGKVVAFYGFCCKPKHTTWALLVEHPGAVVNYGEVRPDSLDWAGLKLGSVVVAGQAIAKVGRNPNGSSMLHFETYVPGTLRNVRWPSGNRPPAAILNPTAYLLLLRDHGLRASATASAPKPAISAPPSSTTPGLDVSRAVKRNAELSRSLGWLARFDDIARVLGFTNSTPDQESFARAVSRWQRQKGLSPDGIIGPTTWAALRPLLPPVPASTTTVPTAGSSSPAAISQPALGGNPVPRGFIAFRRGLRRGSNVRLDSKLRSMRDRNLIQLPDDALDTFQRIANVETSGAITSLNTWDTGVVSIGFMQWTLKYGELQRWIAEAAPAFRRHGIELAQTTYAWPSHSQPGIAGAPDREALRWDGWAERFYNVGLDEEAIAVEVRLAQAKLSQTLARLRSHVGKLGLAGGFEVFERHYGASLEIRGIYQEAYNNLPVAARNGAVRAIQRALAEHSMPTERFLEIFREEILRAYRERGDNGANVIDKTRTGALPLPAREELEEANTL